MTPIEIPHIDWDTPTGDKMVELRFWRTRPWPRWIVRLLAQSAAGGLQ